ncbi:MAG: alpha/beta hydrolase, partial [Beijerinckiaceae bacterium]|nr:alpha/beta hydrolase [Beijerinckiaceae bacterium]
MAASFEGNILTSDPRRHARAAAVIEAAPDLAIGDPTIGWTNASFRVMRRFEDLEFPRRLATPVLILAAGADRLVDSAAADEFASRLKAGKCIMVPGARHEILMEAGPKREIFWAAFDAFLPGGGILRKDESGARWVDLTGAAASPGSRIAPSKSDAQT